MFDITAFWWFLLALGVVFFSWALAHIYDMGPAIKEAFHPAPSPTIPHHTPKAAPKAQATSPSTSASSEDDLKKIEGIGPKIEATLKDAGINTFADLAAQTPEDLQKILDDAGYTRINNPETWHEQAALAAEGKWDELKDFQNSLRQGRRKPA